MIQRDKEIAQDDISADVKANPTFSAWHVERMTMALHQLSVENGVVFLATLYLAHYMVRIQVMAYTNSFGDLLLICAALRIAQTCMAQIPVDLWKSLGADVMLQVSMMSPSI